MLMSNMQLAKILSRHHHTQQTFESCLSRDQMPLAIRHFPSFYVVDIKHSREEGIGHWTACFFTAPDQKSQFFDSYGKSPQYYAQSLHTLLVNNSCGEYEYSREVLQHDESNSCGAFVCYIADLINRGLSLTRAVSTLSTTDLKFNDKVVDKYLFNHMLQ